METTQSRSFVGKPVKGFQILLPTGWVQVLVNDESKKELLRLVSAKFKQAGRPDLDVEVRRMVNAQWKKLINARMNFLYLPMGSDGGSLLAGSIAGRYYSVSESETFVEHIERHANSIVKTFEFEDDITLFRWETGTRPAEGLDGINQKLLGHAFAVPGEPRRGVLFLTSIGFPTDGDKELLRAQVALIDSVVGTFRWTRH